MEDAGARQPEPGAVPGEPTLQPVAGSAPEPAALGEPTVGDPPGAAAEVAAEVAPDVGSAAEASSAGEVGSVGEVEAWAALPPAPPPIDWDDRGTSAGRSLRSAALAVCGAVLVLACLGGTGYAFFSGSTIRPSDLSEPDAGGGVDTGRVASGVSASPSVGVSAGYAASSYAVRHVDDLIRVCDRWYYPQSPPYAGTGVHPITVKTQEHKDYGTRTTLKLTDLPSSSQARAAWEPPDPGTIQLVGCLDRVEGGRTIRSCTFDTPEPDNVPLNEGIYQLTLWEVATHNKVAEFRMTGEKDTCPTIVLLGADRTIYSTVSDRQLTETLGRYTVT